MAKYSVTPELAAIIKAVRLEKHVSSKSVAEHIGKSYSYMSKLEKGDIKTIQEKELTSIFRFIFGNDNGFQDFLDNSLNEILDTLDIRFSDEEIKEQIWFDNYDTVLRLIPVPTSLIDAIGAKMETLNITVEELCKRINSNEGISPEIKNTDDYPFNEWIAYVENHKIKFRFIKMKVASAEIEQILKKEITSCNYVTMLAIVYYLLKSECLSNNVVVEDREQMQNASSFLNSHKFYSIYEKNKLRKQAHSKSELDELLSSFDRENSVLIKEIISSFELFSEINIAKMNKYLAAFATNLHWDSSFMMKLLSMSFSEMKEIGYTAKKELLLEFEKLLVKYQNLPEGKKKIEIYD